MDNDNRMNGWEFLDRNGCGVAIVIVIILSLIKEIIISWLTH